MGIFGQLLEILVFADVNRVVEATDIGARQFVGIGRLKGMNIEAVLESETPEQRLNLFARGEETVASQSLQYIVNA